MEFLLILNATIRVSLSSQKTLIGASCAAAPQAEGEARGEKVDNDAVLGRARDDRLSET